MFEVNLTRVTTLTIAVATVLVMGACSDNPPPQETTVPVSMVEPDGETPPDMIEMGGAKSVTTFFVTSVGPGQGANLGGLAGADAHCQALATAEYAGDHTRRA